MVNRLERCGLDIILTRYAYFFRIKIRLVTDRRRTSLPFNLCSFTRTHKFSWSTHSTALTFRLGTFLTLSGNFFTYFFLPLLVCLAHTSFVCSLNRGGTAFDPCVSPLTNSTTRSSSSRFRHSSNAAIEANTSVYPSSGSPEPYGAFLRVPPFSTCWICSVLDAPLMPELSTLVLLLALSTSPTRGC